MKRKLIILAATMVAILTLTACKGSSKIQGKWHATNPKETSAILIIKKNTLELDGQKVKYTQNGKGFENKTKYYVLKMKKSQELFSIIFPDGKKDEAIMLKINDLDEPYNGVMVFALNKTKKPNYAEYAKKYMSPTE
ncbi:hypothetical protein [Streptococcus parauberis]|uniref:hypothetical protein n=1 Tax=Streptococcus parauberis TaxID=1348 RepID=UPI00378951D8